MFKKPIYYILALSFVFLALTLPRLGQQLLWEDEAERALVGLNTLKYGYPTAWNDRNLVVQFGDEFRGDKLLWIKNAWLQYYILAASFMLLGQNTFAARFPFVIFGLLSLLVALRFHEFFPSHMKGKIQVIIGLLFLTNVSYLVFTRQATYYILGIFFSLLSTYVFFKLLLNGNFNRQKKLILILFFINFLHLQTNILSFVATIVVQNLILIFKIMQKRNVSDILILIIFFLLEVIFYLPWLKFFSASYPPLTNGLVERTVMYFLEFNAYVLPLLIGLPLIILGILKAFKLNQFFKTAPLYILLVSLIQITLATFYGDFYPHFRYLSSLLGIWFILFTIISFSLNRTLGVIFLLIVVLSNFTQNLNKVSGSALVFMTKTRKELREDLVIGQKKCAFCDYLYELTNDYLGPMDPVVTTLNNIGIEDKSLAIGCQAEVVIFYTKAIVTGRISDNSYTNLIPASLPRLSSAYLIDSASCPIGYDKRTIIRNGYKLIKTVNSPLLNQHQNREELVFREFKTKPYESYFELYEKQ